MALYVKAKERILVKYKDLKRLDQKLNKNWILNKIEKYNVIKLIINKVKENKWLNLQNKKRG
jgi:hypothetical protein